MLVFYDSQIHSSLEMVKGAPRSPDETKVLIRVQIVAVMWSALVEHGWMAALGRFAE